MAAAVATMALAATASAAPSAADTCKTAFDCGALGAKLAGKDGDYSNGLRALKRGCDIETNAPKAGDGQFACEQYAMLLIDAGLARGGNPWRGMAMLESMCKARPQPRIVDPSPCGTLAREYDHPPVASGLPRQTDKAAALRSAACDQGGSSLECDALGDLDLHGGPKWPIDLTKARIAYDRGCAMSDVYAAGVCGALGDKLLNGKLGGPPDRNAAMPYLKKSCAEGYRCDLYVELLLQDGKDDEAVAAFDGPRNRGFFKDEWAAKYCSEGHKVMCNRGSSSPTTPF